MGINIIKDFLVMSIRHKTEKVNWEMLGTNASFLPLAYMVVMAPGFLILTGLCAVIATGMGPFYPDFPREFFLALGGSLIVLGALLIFSYRLIIKHHFKLKKCRALENAPLATKSPVENVLAPFLKQMLVEHRLFLGKSDSDIS